MVDANGDAPYDRPNLSKGYLAGTAPEDWLPLHPRFYYADLDIELFSRRSARAIDAGMRREGGVCRVLAELEQRTRFCFRFAPWPMPPATRFDLVPGAAVSGERSPRNLN